MLKQLQTKRSISALALILAMGQAGAADEARHVAETTVAVWNHALAGGQLDDIVSLYSTDAMLVQPNGTISKSSGEIRAFWQGLIANRSGVFAIDLVDARSGQDDTVVATLKLSDTKTVRSSAPTPQLIRYHYDGVLYSVLRRQQDGSWKAQVQQWSDKTRS